MAISKVIYGDTTLIDLTYDSVTADKLAAGYTAHNSAGNAITGTGVIGLMPPGFELLASTLTLPYRVSRLMAGSDYNLYKYFAADLANGYNYVYEGYDILNCVVGEDIKLYTYNFPILTPCIATNYQVLSRTLNVFNTTVKPTFRLYRIKDGAVAADTIHLAIANKDDIVLYKGVYLVSASYSNQFSWPADINYEAGVIIYLCSYEAGTNNSNWITAD